MAAENVVCFLQLSIIVGLCLPDALPLELFQQGFHLQREVHVPISGRRLRLLRKDLLAGDLHHIPLDVDGPFQPVDVAPLQAAALATAHPGGDDELEVCLVFEALFLQGGDEPLGGGLVGNHLLFLLPGVAVGPPGWVVIQKAALHGIGEDRTQRCVYTLHGALGERLSCFLVFGFS